MQERALTSAVVLILCIVVSYAAIPNPGPFPLQTVVDVAFANLRSAPDPTPTGLTKEDYLNTIEGIVTYFRAYQQPDGRIIDPVEKVEIQYSTPTFALASAVLYSVRKDPAVLKCSIMALEVPLV
jgi:hypothetical protein